MKKTILLFLSAVMATALCGAPAAAKKAPAALKMALPEIIYAAPGIESNIYFENAVDSAVFRNYAYEVRCPVGTQGEYRWFWTPSPKDAGKSFDLELRLFDDDGLVISGKCKVKVAGKPAAPGKKYTLALLGASGVNSGYPTWLMKAMREQGFSGYTPVGSHSGGGRGPAPDRAMHDGYGGFSWSSFLTRWMYSAEELPPIQNEAEKAQMRTLGVTNLPKSQAYRLRSPLLKLVNGKPVLDIPGWFRKINQGQAPDCIVIQLGGNDMFITRPEKLDDRIREVMGNVRHLLSELRKNAPRALIGVATCPCGCGQDGFGANYGCKQSKYQFRRNIQRYNRELTALVGSLKDPRVVMIPLHQNIDPDGSYMRRSVKVHARSNKKVPRECNALHPGAEGGAQLGDAIACWLMNHLEK